MLHFHPIISILYLYLWLWLSCGQSEGKRDLWWSYLIISHTDGELWLDGRVGRQTCGEFGRFNERLARLWNWTHGYCDFFCGWLVEVVDIDWNDISLLLDKSTFQREVSPVCFLTGHGAPLGLVRWQCQAVEGRVSGGNIITDDAMVRWENRFNLTRERLHGEIRVTFTTTIGHGTTWGGFKGRERIGYSRSAPGADRIQPTVVGCILIISAGQLTDALHWLQIHTRNTRPLLIAW